MPSTATPSTFGSADPGSFKIKLSPEAALVLLRTWFVLLLAGGHVLLPILAATFAFSRAKRHATLINMCITWILTTVISSLLFYANQYNDAPNPTLCIAQASIMYAGPPMVAASAFGLIYHVWSTAFASPGKGASSRRDSWRTILLLVLPYLSFIGFAIPGAILSVSHPQDVSLSRRILYCSLLNELYSGINAVYTAVILLATIYYELRIMMILRRNWVGFRDCGLHVAFDLQLIVRVVIFGVFIVIGFILAISTIFFSTLGPDFFTAAVPLVIFMVFGLSTDVLRVWTFSHKTTRKHPTIRVIKLEDV